MRFGAILILFVIFITMLVGQTVRENEGSDYNITNLTEQIQYQNISYELKSNINQADKIQVGLYKFMDAFAYTTVEVGKESIKYGFNHPEYDFALFIDILKMFMYFMIFMMLISRLPYIAAIIYVLGLGLWKLFTINWKKRYLLYKARMKEPRRK